MFGIRWDGDIIGDSGVGPEDVHYSPAVHFNLIPFMRVHGPETDIETAVRLPPVFLFPVASQSLLCTSNDADMSDFA